MKSEELINFIKARRKEKGFNQTHMAEQLGVSQNMYSRYERMESEIPLSSFLKIAEVLEIEIFKNISLIDNKDLDMIQDFVNRYREKS